VILGALGRAIYWTLGAVQATVEVAGTVSRLVRQMRKGIVPMVDDTQPIPLTPERAAARRAAGSTPGESGTWTAGGRRRP